MAQGTYTSSLQTRVDSENYIAGTPSGVYNVAHKLQYLWSVVNGTPTAFTVPTVTILNIQMYEFTVDAGTVANPVTVTFTSNTAATVAIPMIAGNLYYWDISQVGTTGTGAQMKGGIFQGSFITTTYTVFGVTLASATYNIPAALSISSANFTGRICVI